MVNIDKLRGKIVEKRTDVETVAAHIGMNKSTLYRRINGGGGSFTVEEAGKISDVLGLTANEFNEIFFAQFVARRAT